ncbi:MAG: membrane protein insertion efficiency factor YidD [Bacteroidota bacterium]
MKTIAIFSIQLYRLIISPLLPVNTCRFYPTCSAYSIDAIRKYGFWKGLLLSLKRLSRCHPLNAGGYDPIE